MGGGDSKGELPIFPEKEETAWKKPEWKVPGMEEEQIRDPSWRRTGDWKKKTTGWKRKTAA